MMEARRATAARRTLSVEIVVAIMVGATLVEGTPTNLHVGSTSRVIELWDVPVDTSLRPGGLYRSRDSKSFVRI